MKLTLITCTSDRHFCFERCEYYGRRCLEQYDGEVEWIVADGGMQPVVCTQGQQHIVNGYEPDPLTNFHQNMFSALRRASGNAIVFFEDDDWYHPRYIENAVASLGLYDLVGEGNAKYFHVTSRCYKQFDNNTHASLCSTVAGPRGVDAIKRAVNEFKDPYVDLRVWKTCGLRKKMILTEQPNCVGIKGMPGKRGFVPGHKPDYYSMRDASGELLRRWLGDCVEDAEFYLQFGESENVAVGQST